MARSTIRSRGTDPASRGDAASARPLRREPREAPRTGSGRNRRSRRTLWILCAAIGLAAAGCDPLYGINRHALLPSLPDLSCVETAIRSVPGVGAVRRESEEGGRPITWTGIQAPDRNHYFHYEVGPWSASLLLSVDHAGEVELSQHLVQLGEPMPQEAVDTVRPVMVQIERALAERCGVEPLGGAIEEHRSGVD